MKKLTLFCGAAALALASCSNDELVENIAADQGADAPIGFAVSTGNMTRAAGDPTQLSDEHWDFGVWAYKGTSAPTTSPAVMTNYLVGYWDITNQQGYEPKNNQDLFGSNASKYVWYYQGLGSEEAKDVWTDAEGISHSEPYFKFIPGLPGEKVATSENPYQYLKYWDRAADTQNWFYACAPYYKDAQFDNENHKLTFPVISSVKDENAMYAAKKIASPNADATKNTYVDLQFNRLLAQVRLAFYEVVEGYSVELIDYSTTTIPTDDLWTSFGSKAMYAVPAIKNGSLYDRSLYVTSAQPVVTFGGADLVDVESISYENQKTSDANINIPLWFFDKMGVQTNVLGTNRDDAIMNQSKNVLPSGTTYCGFTINLSLRFTALDTGETIDVKGVRVFIPKDDCQWVANHRYTYYFKITKNVPGTPTDPGEPTPTPSNDPYLMPIVFDNVTVEAIQVEETSPEDDYIVK